MKKFRAIMMIGAVAIATTIASASAANAVPSNAVKSPIPGMSKFLAFPFGEFGGNPQVIDTCGSTDIRNHGSYQWYGFGQDGQMFEGGRHVWTLNSDLFARQGTGFGWDRIFIIC